MTMTKYLICGCGQQVNIADKNPGDVVACPGCGSQMPVSGNSPEEFARLLAETRNMPGMFVNVRLNDDAPASKEQPVPQPKSSWFGRMLRKLGLG